MKYNLTIFSPTISELRLFISVYDGDEDVKKFIKIRSEARLSKEKVVIRDRSLSSDKDFGLTISNRAGMLENAEHTIMPLKKKMEHQKTAFF